MNVVYDTGVLVAADRHDRRVWAEHRVRLELGVVPVVTAPVVAQASRSGKQVPLRRLLRGCEVVALSPDEAHDVGALLGRSETTGVVDAHVAIVAAQRHAVVLTGDVGDLSHLSDSLPQPLSISAI